MLRGSVHGPPAASGSFACRSTTRSVQQGNRCGSENTLQATLLNIPDTIYMSTVQTMAEHQSSERSAGPRPSSKSVCAQQATHRRQRCK